MENIIEINDEKIITKILHEAFLTVAQEFGYTKENAPTFNAFINSDRVKNQMENGLKMYGYMHKNNIIGCIGYSFYNDNIYVIERLAVIPKHRHLGIGKVLLDFIEKEIKKENGEMAEIHIFDDNIKLKAWYKKLGYKETRVEEKEHFPFKAYIMQKYLNKI